MKKLLLFTTSAFLFLCLIVPFQSSAFDLNRSIQKIKKFDNANITGYIINKKAAVRIKDRLKVAKKAIFNKTVLIRGKLTGEDAAEFAGNISGLNFNSTTDITSIDTTDFTGGELYYDSTNAKSYVWSGTAWLDITQQNSDTTYTAGNGIAIDSSDEVTTDETYSHTWTSDQTFSDDVTVAGQAGVNGTAVNDSYGINNTADEDGERAENITVSADTDGITNYGSYYSVDAGSTVLTSGDRVPTGIQMDVTAGAGYDGTWSYYTNPIGYLTSIDATADALEESSVTAYKVYTSGATGNKQHLNAYYSYLQSGGTGSTAYGMNNRIDFETGSAQTATAYYAGNFNADAGDTYKGLEVYDWNNTAGTAYGLHIDLDDPYDTAYSIWVEPGSAPSSLGDIYKASPTSAPPETCNGTWAGSFYYDSDLNLPCVCNGTNWLQMDDFVSVCS